MGKMEIEVKILNIDVENVRNRIMMSGGQELGIINQRLFTYDLPTICGRYYEILNALNSSSNKIIQEVNFMRIKNLLFEINQLNPTETVKIYKAFNVSHLEDILLKEDYLKILNSEEMISYISKITINPNKWIRLRESNGKATIATKHILLNNGTKIQQLLETEVEVSDFEEANDLLMQMGFVHKSYQEKRRIPFILYDHEIDIDFWPGIPPFLEMEGKSEEDIESVLKKIGYTIKDTISCTADEVYRLYGKNMFELRELKFQ